MDKKKDFFSLYLFIYSNPIYTHEHVVEGEEDGKQKKSNLYSQIET